MKLILIALFFLALATRADEGESFTLTINLAIESGQITTRINNGNLYNKENLNKTLSAVYKHFGKDSYIGILVEKNIPISEIISLRDIVTSHGFSKVKIFMSREENESYFLQEITIHQEKEYKNKAPHEWREK